MIYSVLVFLAKGGFAFFIFGFGMLNWGLTGNKKHTWFKWVFCFKALETIQLKPREAKNTKDSIYNFLNILFFSLMLCWAFYLTHYYILVYSEYY